jgi:branched-chain amino acid transport system ATP-binding protein
VIPAADVSTSDTDATVGVPILSVSELNAGYDRTNVLHDISFEVPTSTVVALLGPNGAGKTTLLRALSGLLTPSSGSVRLAGREITSMSAARRRNLGLCLVPEGRGIFPSLTVLENIQVQARRSDRSRMLEQILEVFPGLRDRLRQVAGSMSGGQQQMLALAKCYVRDSRVVLIDEVSRGLAPIVIDEVYGALRGLRDAGVSLLLVEQYVDRALDLSDSVYALSKGNLRSLGSPGGIDRDDLHRRYLGGSSSAG